MNYEYKTLKLSNSDMENNILLEDTLNKYGSKGWELINFNTQSHIGSSQYSLLGFSSKTILIFKRAIS